MFATSTSFLKIMAILSLVSLLGACFDGAPEVPGDVSNARLASMLQDRFDAELASLDPRQSPGLIAQAPRNARLWLEEIEEVVARCRYGPGNRSKANRLVYDIALKDGGTVPDVYSGQRCTYGFSAPLVMRARFDGGRVIQVLTDGRELKAAPDTFIGDLAVMARQVVRADWQRRPVRYYPPAPSQSEIARDWERR